MSTLDDRLAALDAELRPLRGVLVAFSGGVDSGVVLAAAIRHNAKSSSNCFRRD